MLRLTAALGVGLALLLAGCGGDDEGGQVTTNGCEEVEAPNPKPDGGFEQPTERLDPERTYRLVVETNCGAFTIELDQAKAPATTASLVSLARAGFFDDTTFHRIVPDFVIQGGDPTGTGSGGPGYQTVDPPPQDTIYTKGTVAMAKAEDELAGTSGSQFFVVTGEESGLTPDYAVVGRVTDGADIVERIGRLGGPSQEPTRPVVMRKVSVDESG